jgi:hypothetical protein
MPPYRTITSNEEPNILCLAAFVAATQQKHNVVTLFPEIHTVARSEEHS